VTWEEPVPFVELDGITTYYEQHGAGEPVLLLHGGFASAETWQPQIESLAQDHRLHVPERPGQGRTPDRDGPFTHADMVRDTLAYLDAFELDSVHVVGHSDGAITGLFLALEHPERVRSLVSISGNLDPDAFVTDEEAESIPTAGTSDVRAAYDRLSPDGPGHADVVLEKLMQLWTTEPHIDPAQLARITVPTLVMAGDRDMVTTAHTTTMARSIAGAQLCIVPGAGHMVTEQRPALVNIVLREFLAGASH
jgi:pimeloyl-ACP methyl ester carboxylesterase